MLLRGRVPAVVAGVAVAALVVGLLPALSGTGVTSAADGADPAASWQPGDSAAVGALASATLPGVASPVEYAYGLDYAGEAGAEPGAAITGSAPAENTEEAGAQDGVIRVLQGDTLTGSAAAWGEPAEAPAAENAENTGTEEPAEGAGVAPAEDPAGEAAPVEAAAAEAPSAPSVVVQPVPGQAPETLAEALTVQRQAPAANGAVQARWQIVQADAAQVNQQTDAGQEPAAIEAGAEGGPAARASVFVVNPAIEAVLEASTDGGTTWASEATAPAGAEVVWRVTATNTGNVDLADVKVATATANETDTLDAGVGAEIGALPVGATGSATFTTEAGDIAAGVSVSGVFDAEGPDGAPLVDRFTDAAGTVGRVPSGVATAEVAVAPAGDEEPAESGSPDKAAQWDSGSTDEGVAAEDAEPAPGATAEGDVTGEPEGGEEAEEVTVPATAEVPLLANPLLVGVSMAALTLDDYEAMAVPKFEYVHDTEAIVPSGVSNVPSGWGLNPGNGSTLNVPYTTCTTVPGGCDRYLDQQYFYVYVYPGESINVRLTASHAYFSNSASNDNLRVQVRRPGGNNTGYPGDPSGPYGTHTFTGPNTEVLYDSAYANSFGQRFDGTWSERILSNANAGVWEIVLQRFTSSGKTTTPYGSQWEVGVTQGPSDQLVPGRAWTDELGLLQRQLRGGEVDASPADPFSLYVVSPTGARWKTDFLGYNGINSIISFGSLGNVRSDSCVNAYASYDSGGDVGVGGNPSNLRRGGQACPSTRYHIFFNPPAADLPEDWYDIWIAPKPKNPGTPELTYQQTGAGGVPAAGDFVVNTFDFLGTYRLQIDADGNGVYTDPADVDVQHSAGDADSTFTYSWDGKDGLGAPVSGVDGVKARVVLEHADEIHLVTVDTEVNSGGFSWTKTAGFGANGLVPLMWDDSQMNAASADISVPAVQLSGDATPGARSFQTVVNDSKIMDTWGYSESDIEVEIPLSDLSLEKQGALTKGGSAAVAGDTVTYTFTVTNSGDQALTNVVITDPLLGGPVSMSGAVWSPNTPGTLAPGGTVTVTATYPLTADDIAAGHVDNTATVTTQVQGGGDGPSATDSATVSFDAPTPPEPESGTVLVKKEAENSGGVWAGMAGSQWAIWSDASGTVFPGAVVTPVAAGGCTVDAACVFQVTGLEVPGEYWLVETHAPAGFSLLAQPVKFSLAAGGVVTLGSGAGANVSVAKATEAPFTDLYQIRVRDVPTTVLPEAGGPGTWWVWLLGCGVILAGFAVAYGPGGVRRRRYGIAGGGGGM
ncbi:DUF7507 domain-containing protein [Leucobacter massiliensis]|uniref:DUF7507 domain-containing protein n=1 Tax=Leucobacter massiliensis TaxID=1686285 RepID=A0A2S9QPS5_9MICO|nr:SpaA isopeptide-forming pilin-related protein [Leucobacter massiliensis]PRI11586.1 hypothetical protein B4915_05570 [Leucobacter massiliensis]